MANPRIRGGGRILLCAIALFAGACAELDPALVGELLGGLASAPDERRVAAGLTEALEVGSRRTVDATSRTDGFFGNALIRVAIPGELDTMARALRAIGLSRQVDSFELAMNRAAERASGEAVDVLVGSIRRMTWQDALGILNGGRSAATDYFRRSTSAELRTRFSPIVESSMQRVGVVRIYGELESAYSSLPLAPRVRFDLEGYVTDRAIDGLFVVLAQEEARIREDPAARTTALLREVFGR